MAETTRDPAFEVWLKEVDHEVWAEAGVSRCDIADKPWYDWFESGMDPDEAARQALEEEGFSWGAALDLEGLAFG